MNKCKRACLCVMWSHYQLPTTTPYQPSTMDINGLRCDPCVKEDSFIEQCICQFFFLFSFHSCQFSFLYFLLNFFLLFKVAWSANLMLWRCDVVIVVVAPACVVANQSNACVFLTHANITKAHPSARELIVKIQRKNKESPLKRMFVDFVCLLKPLTTKTKRRVNDSPKFVWQLIYLWVCLCVWIHGKHCERVRMGRILTTNDKRTPSKRLAPNTF